MFIYWQNIDDSEKCGDSFEYYAYYTSTTADNQTMLVLTNNLYFILTISFLFPTDFYVIT